MKSGCVHQKWIRGGSGWSLWAGHLDRPASEYSGHISLYRNKENIITTCKLYEPDIWNIGTCMNLTSGILERV